MIERLYNLKKTQTDQKFLQKAQFLAKQEKLNSEIMFTQNKIDTATLQRFGSVSDFAVLEMHKNTMREHISKLEKQKEEIDKQVDEINEELVELHKETEQFLYLLEEEKQEKIQRVLKAEQEAADEFIQSKYVTK
ncbi:MAG: hypothetical protein ACQERD_06695 [Campylobacterota bacterium]